MSDAEQAIRLYEMGKDEELWALAERVWPTDGELTVEIAEVSYFARAAYARAASQDDDLRKWRLARVWGARAMVAAVATGSKQTGARLLLPEFFWLIANGDSEAARAVLHEMPKLVDTSPNGGDVDSSVFPRLFHEKLAYSYVQDGMYSDAEQHYRQALHATQDDLRGTLKVRGGLALVLYLGLSDPTDTAAQGLRSEFEAIRQEAAEGSFLDVIEVADHNLRWLGGEETDWKPFEVT